ncbi:MAG: M20/M25/M40 family metallo-hydrolase [Candidatus Brocadiales bacterium]|nr:M20/M25/M40 family metallo-hydrolase [Candidatus Brocadiales bacterium]
MTKHLTDLQKKLVALTRDLIMIPSDESRPDDIEHCFEFIINHLESLDTVVIKKHYHRGITSLVALPKKMEHPKILLCGHLDVITHSESNCYRSHITDGKIIGPGSGDMKGSLAVLLEVFMDLHMKHDNLPLGLAITSDEERGGDAGMRFLFDEIGLRCEVALVPDGGSLNEVIIEEKGAIHLTIKCHGHSAHAARPWLGDNPLERLVDAVFRLRKDIDSLSNDNDHWHPTCALTIIKTPNQTVNCIPSEAEGTLDIRFPAPYTTNEILSRISNILGDEVDTHTIMSAEPTQFTPDPLYLSVSEEVIGKPTIQKKEDGGSDARFIGCHNIPVIVSRPIVGELHSLDEWIDISSMETFYRIYELYLKRKMLLCD